MKTFTVFANCQSTAIAKTLLENREFNQKYRYVPIKPVQLLRDDDAHKVCSIAKEVDLFIYQPIKSTPRRPETLTSLYLLNQLSRTAVSVSFPSIYFDGYFPHLQSLNGWVAKLNLVHDYFIAYLSSKKFLVSDICSILQNDNLYPKELSISLFNRAVNELENREINENIDIHVSSFIKENHKTSKLFNQFNHPKRKVIRFVAESILSKIDIDNFLISEEGPSHLDEIVTPIYRSTFKNLELNFHEDFELYSTLKNKEMLQKEVVSEFYDFYNKQDPEKIKESVKKFKPFIVDIVDKLN